jgi:ketosteroid isomerase-like protein
MSTSQNVETAEKGYAAYSASDLETTLSVFDDSIQFVVPGNSTISRTYSGKAQVMGLFAKLAEQSFTIAPSRFLADDDVDVVVVLSQVTAGGESAPQADVYTFRHGKIVIAQSFPDTAMQERVYGTK